MSFKAKHLFLGVIAAAGVAAASPALAAPDVCTVVPSNLTYDATIAVASNFYQPAQDLVADFTSPGQPGDGYHIRICQNSTTTLYNEIITGTAGFSLFLAANTATPVSLQGTAYVQTGATAQLYALGIPVLFGRYNATTLPDTHTLIPALASGHRTDTINSQVTTSQALSTSNSQTVAVANVTAAPYGTAAQNILADMGYTVSNTTIPTWVHSPLYDNIDLTFQSVASSPYPNKSGFVSKSQVCDGSGSIDSSYVGIEFKYNSNSSSNYLPFQSGILVTSGNSGQDAIGASIFSFMLSNSDPTYWSDFLVAHCYEQIPATANVLKQKHTPAHKYKNYHRR